MALSPAYEQWQAETLQQGRQEGRQEGQQEGQLNLVLRQLVRKVGTLDPSLRSRIESLSPSGIEALGEALLEFRSEADLLEWLRERG